MQNLICIYALLEDMMTFFFLWSLPNDLLLNSKLNVPFCHSLKTLDFYSQSAVTLDSHYEKVTCFLVSGDI